MRHSRGAPRRQDQLSGHIRSHLTLDPGHIILAQVVARGVPNGAVADTGATDRAGL